MIKELKHLSYESELGLLSLKISFTFGILCVYVSNGVKANTEPDSSQWGQGIRQETKSMNRNTGNSI